MRLAGWKARALACLVVVVVAFGASGPAHAQERAGRGGTVVDRVAVRFVSPETGGPARPRFVTEREVALFTRLEALAERTSLGPTEYPERYVRTAVDRIVARAMLASLMIQRGSEPPDLPRLAAEMRADLADRVGGPAQLEDAMKKEGFDESEITAFLYDQVRAAFYVDKLVTPIFTVTEDALREAFRTTLHPYRTSKFEDARVRFKRWLTVERLRAAEIEFLQGARSRLRVVTVTAERAER